MQRRDLLTSAAALPAIGLGLGTGRMAAAQGGGTGLPDAQRFAIGDLSVTALSDGALRIEPGMLSGVDEGEYADLLEARFRDPETYRSAVNGFLIEGSDGVILVDAGTGGALGPDLGKLVGNLGAVGVRPDDVTMLFATHLHPDHVGGAVADGTATFPNAELVVAEAERAFWTDAEIKAQAGPDNAMFFDLASGVVAAYENRLQALSGETQIAPGLTTMPLPGHTPGHTGLMIESGGDSLLIWADIVHVPPVQFARPDVTIGFDADPEQAAATRAEILDRVVADRLMVAGSHMGFPGLGHVERAGEGYRLIDAAYEYNS